MSQEMNPNRSVREDNSTTRILSHWAAYYPLKEHNSVVLCRRNEFLEETKISQDTVCKFRRPAPSQGTAEQTWKNVASTEAL
jgi:hypothetical protein